MLRFFLTWIRSQICEKPDPEPLFIFGNSRSLRANTIAQVKTLLKFRLHRWLPEFEQESDAVTRETYEAIIIR